MTSYRKDRAIYDHSGRMYTLIEEISRRCKDESFKVAARRMVNEIKQEAGELWG